MFSGMFTTFFPLGGTINERCRYQCCRKQQPSSDDRSKGSFAHILPDRLARGWYCRCTY